MNLNKKIYTTCFGSTHIVFFHSTYKNVEVFNMHRYVYFQDKTLSIHNAGIIRILWWELLVLCTFSIYNAQQKT